MPRRVPQLFAHNLPGGRGLSRCIVGKYREQTGLKWRAFTNTASDPSAVIFNSPFQQMQLVVL